MGINGIPYKVSYRAVKYPRLEFKTGELLIILPFGYKPEIFIEKHKGWINKKFNFIKECMNKAEGKKLIIRTEEEFRNLIYSFIKEISEELRVEINHIYFRNMRTKWASISSAKNLTVNNLMKYLPEHLIRYIIFHELVHLIERRHNKRFWKIVSKKYQNYKRIEKELFIYWFLIYKERE